MIQCFRTFSDDMDMDEKSWDIEISDFLVVPDIRRTNRRSCDMKSDSADCC